MSAKRWLIVAGWSLAGLAQAGEVRPIIKAGIDTGGDTVVTANFIGGDSERVRANEGAFVGGGMSWVDDSGNLEVEIALTYKFALVDANNGDIEFTRVPLDAMLFYRTTNFRFGGGLTYHINPKIQGDGIVGGLDIQLKDALGLLLQADWRITQKINLGLRYTYVEYKAEGNFTGTAKSDGMGVVFSMRF
jgi:outer membrane receptor protein involved in Fe transport